MPLTLALLLTQFGLALAILGQACEHRHASKGERRLFAWRALAAVFLLVGIIAEFIFEPLLNDPHWATIICGCTGNSAEYLTRLNALTAGSQLLRAAACWAIFSLGIVSLKRFGGPYCGGSDLMTLQVSVCMALAESTFSPAWRLGATGYLCFQVCLSYWQAGWVKLINPQWRNGHALREVFAFTHYPVSEATRQWAKYPRLLCGMSWLIILMEFLFPLSLYDHWTLYAALLFMGLFHVANAWLFGLNRFFWIWLATYPTLIAWQPIIAEFMRR